MSETSTRNLLSQEELDFLLAPTAAGDGEDSALQADAGAVDQDADGDTTDARADGGADNAADDDMGDEGNDAAGTMPPLQNIDGGTLAERCFASLFERALGVRMGAYARLDLEAAETRAWSSAEAELDSSGWYVLLDAGELTSRLLFCLDERLTQALADASLGAGARHLGARRITALDLALVRRVTCDLAGCLSRSWDLTSCTPRREVRRVRDIFLTEDDELVRAAVYRMEVESAVGRCRLIWPLSSSGSRL